MKKLLYLLLFASIIFSITAKAQFTFCNSGVLKIDSGTIVSIKGSLYNNKGGRIYNGGLLYITDNITNNSDTIMFKGVNGSYHNGVGKVVLNGTSTQIIAGDSVGVAFTKLTLNNNDTLKLEKDIFCKDTLFLKAGNIFLNGNNITLEQHKGGTVRSEGNVYGENENNRIFGTAGEIIASNYYIVGGDSVNIANLGFVVSLSKSVPSFTLKRGHHYYPNVADTSIYRYYVTDSKDITGFESSLELNYLDKEYDGLIRTTESDFKIWYSSDNGQSFTKRSSEWDVANNNKVTSTEEFSISAGIYTISDAICDVLPEADVADTAICELATLSLRAASTNNVDNKYFWSSTDIDISALDTNNFKLEVPWDSLKGKLEMKFYLLVRNANGCESIDSSIVVIKANPKVDLVNLNPNNCEGDSIIFVAPKGMDIYKWELGLGNTSSNVDSLTIPYDKAGEYEISLTVDSLYCKSKVLKRLYIKPLPEVDFVLQDFCSGLDVLFENKSGEKGNPSIFSSIWNYGEGVNDTLPENNNGKHKYRKASTYSVKLKVKSSAGCVNSITKDVIISASVIANFTTNNVCKGELASFINLTNTVSGTKYIWNFGDRTSATTNNTNPNTTHLYAVEGTYNVELTAETGSGCNSVFNQQIIVHPFAKADFTIQDVCLNESSIFSNTTTTLAGNTYQWSFGDGNTSANISPTNLYSIDNAYQVQLIVVTDKACADTVIKTHNVNPLPTSSFSVDDVCFGEPSLFTNTFTNNASTNYYWNYGNTTTAISNNLSPDLSTVYTNSGIYDVQLIVENSFSCTDTVEHKTTVKALPVISLNDTSATCTGSVVLNPGNAGSSFIWSTGKISQTIETSNEGEYSVTVTNPNTTCSNSFTTQVLLNSTVIVDLGNDQAVCDSITLDAGYFKTYKWSTSETTQMISVNTTGIYSVTVTDINDCIASDFISLTVNSSPIVDLGSDITVCKGAAISLDAQNTGASFLWNTTETSQQINIINSGDYTVTVTDNNNNCSTTSNPLKVTINNNPQQPFINDDVFACNSLMLNAKNVGCTYVWNNGASSQITEALSSGLYSVEITNAKKCTITDSITVDMNYINKVELGNDTNICEGNYIVLNQNDKSTTNTYLWSNNAKSQKLQVASTGDWSVTKYSSNGCTSSDTINITVNPTPVFDLGEDLYLCSNSGLELSSPIESNFYQWKVGGDVISTFKDINITDIGTYTLTLNNTHNCSFSDSITIEATPFLSTPQFLVKSYVKVGDTLQFVNLTYPEPYSYFWSFGDGAKSTNADPSHIYYMEGTFNVYFEAITGNCNASVTKQITVSGYNSRLKQMLDEPIHYEEIIDFVSVMVFPNPTNGKFNLEIELTQKTDVMLIIFDMQGRVLQNKMFKNEFYIFEQYDYSHLSPGMYFVKVLVGDKNKLFKVIIN